MLLRVQRQVLLQGARAALGGDSTPPLAVVLGGLKQQRALAVGLTTRVPASSRTFCPSEARRARSRHAYAVNRDTKR